MYIDIEANDNLDDNVIATFRETGSAKPVQAIRLWQDGVW
jgi:hypothetical protein